MGRCGAPCMGLVSDFLYKVELKMVEKIFELDFDSVKKYFRTTMKSHASKLEFEKAQSFKVKIETLEKLQSKLEPVRIRIYNKKALEIKRNLNLNHMPLIIEAFDNSHNQGDCNVAASVRFVNEKPEKSQYRKYIIRTVKGVDDYASFDEVLERRFSRIIKEKTQLPNLVLIDGGVGQLNVAKKVFEKLELIGKVDLISISKDQSHRSSIVHTIDGKKHDLQAVPNFSILGKVQEEVHRFAIKFHRDKSTKKIFG
jgi:excinuclease ABC subunit C